MQIAINNQVYVTSRIFCIGKNYRGHVREMGGTPPEEPVVFMKPATCLVPPGKVLFHPGYGGELHHEVEAVILIGKEGRNIPEEEAETWISGLTIGLDLTLRDIQRKLKSKGHPWELAKSFDQSAPVGRFTTFHPDKVDLDAWPFSCLVNGELRQEGNTQDMLFPVNRLIRDLSYWWTLLPGDIIYTGTPAGVGPVWPGDVLEIRSPYTGPFSWTVSSKK